MAVLGLCWGKKAGKEGILGGFWSRFAVWMVYKRSRTAAQICIAVKILRQFDVWCGVLKACFSFVRFCRRVFKLQTFSTLSLRKISFSHLLLNFSTLFLFLWESFLLKIFLSFRFQKQYSEQFCHFDIFRPISCFCMSFCCLFAPLKKKDFLTKRRLMNS